MEKIDMKMHHIEIVGPGRDPVQHDDVGGQRIVDAVQTQRARTTASSSALVRESPLAKSVTL